MQALEILQKKQKKERKPKLKEYKHNYREVPLSKVSLVCKICGYELPVMKITTRSPVFCPKGCGMPLSAEVVKNLSNLRFSTSHENLRIADKPIIRRYK